MSARWPWVKLDDLVEITDRGEAVDTAKTYRLLGVRLEGQGPFLRETVTGAQTSATKFYRVAKGDFIYSRLFAWRGAFGLIDDDLDGCHVSNEFPTFTTKDDRLDLRYLKYWFRLPQVLARVEEHCTGSTPQTRNRFKEKFFLNLTIPLPPLSEQRRLVGRIEAVAGLVAEAQALRKEAVEEVEGLVQRASAELLDEDKYPIMSLGDVLFEPPRNGLSPKAESEDGAWTMLRINAVSSTPTRFVDLSASKKVAALDSEAEPFRLKDGDVFIVRYNGDINRVAYPAIHRSSRSDRIAYPDKLMRLRVDPAVADPDFLVYALRSPFLRAQIEELGRTTAGNIGINGGQVKAFEIPLPDMPTQRRIVRELDALQAQVDALKALQSETQAELDALLPAVLAEVFGGQEPPAEAATSKPATVVRAAAYAEPVEALPMAAEPSARLRRGPGRPATAKDAGAQEAILAFLGSHPGWHGKAAILEGAGVAAGAWNAAISALVKAGKVERAGERKGARYRVG